jgi:hypothetical protein
VTGELFFFVNDSALPLQRNAARFYENNRGTACIRVVRFAGNAEGSADGPLCAKIAADRGQSPSAYGD